MAIGAINGIYEYSSTYQLQFFDVSVSAERLNDLMEKYGIQQTGDAYEDLKALRDAINNEAIQMAYAAASSAAGTQISNQSDSENVPWVSVMEQIGLTPTGNINTDYNTFNNKIYELQSNATSADDIAKISQIEAEGDRIFSAQAEKEDGTANIILNSSGSDIIAEINRLFLFGG